MTKIATWNVNSVRARAQHLETWLTDFKPDIVLLQELKCQEEQFPREQIEHLGYNVAIVGQNLAQARHKEFSHDPPPAVAMTRTAYATLTWTR